MAVKKHKALKIFLIIILSIAVIIAVLVGCYAFKNMTCDENQLKKTYNAGFTEKQATLSDGTVINYAEGPNNGPAVLLIHGQTMTWEDYSTVLPQLAKDWHVYAADCQGHGKSSRLEGYTCAGEGDEFIEFIQDVIGGKTVVSGHSSGGVLAAYIAANGGDYVSGAVLEDPPFFSVRPDEMQNTFVWKDGFKLMAEYMNSGSDKGYVPYYYEHSYLFNMFGEGLCAKLSADAAAQVQADPQGYRVKFWYIPNSWTHGTYYYSTYDMNFGMAFYNDTWLSDGEQEEILAGIVCPTVYLKAETSYGADGVLYAANEDADADKMMSLIPNCEKLTIKSGHDIHYEKPQFFVDAFETLREKAGL